MGNELSLNCGSGCAPTCENCHYSRTPCARYSRSRDEYTVEWDSVRAATPRGSSPTPVRGGPGENSRNLLLHQNGQHPHQFDTADGSWLAAPMAAGMALWQAAEEFRINPMHHAGAPTKLEVGDTVTLTEMGRPRGIVRHSGHVHFSEGVFVGVELETPNGVNDGAVSGLRYFTCKAKHGIFVRPHACVKEELYGYSGGVGKNRAANADENSYLPVKTQADNSKLPTKAFRYHEHIPALTADKKALSEVQLHEDEAVFSLSTGIPNERERPWRTTSRIKK